MKKKIFWRIILSLWGIFLFCLAYKEIREIREKRIYIKKREIAWSNLKRDLEKKVENFKGKTGIFIKDLETGWEIFLNKEEIFPAASLIKIPIMVTCFYAVEEGKISLEDTIKLKSSDKVLGSGILKKLPAGKVFTIDELIELMITLSDNTATNLLIEKLGFEYLNNYFKKIGLKNTELKRKMMDFRYRKQGIDNYTSACDMGDILEKIYRGKILDKKYSSKSIQLLLQQKFRDRIPAKLPSEIMVANKTGLEKGVCHDAGIVFGPKGDFIIVVLTKGVESKIAKKFISEISFLVYNHYF